MDTNFAARILALPESVRAALATVEGPGWRISRTGHAIAQPSPDPHELMAGYAWWSVNPARAVAVVTGWSFSACYTIIAVRLQAGESDDHAAALAIIEAHVARSAQ